MRSNKRLLSFAIGSFLTASGLQAATDQAKSDVQIRAMLDELERSRTLQLNQLDRPYFISYSSDDAYQVTINSSLGGLTAVSRNHLRIPQITVRVGDAKFDNTNSIYSGAARVGFMPIDDDYTALRTQLWLATDAIYKNALEQISLKRTAAREIGSADTTPDLAPAAKVQELQPVEPFQLDTAVWQARLRSLSARFEQHPDVLSSGVDFLALGSTYRLVNSEGTVVRVPEDLAQVEIRAASRASDGQPVWDHIFLTAQRVQELPDEKSIGALVDEIGSETEALSKAPLAEEYSGPVLFEQEAAAQLMAELMADASRLLRRPLAPPGSAQGGMLDNVWSSRIGTKVTPEWLSITDDPTQTSFAGKPLAGSYAVDDQGVAAQRVNLVQKGVLTTFLTSREPVRTLNASNGHGRLPGPYGTQLPVIGNLFVQASESLSEPQIKARLIERVKAAGLKYGILIRRMDFPSTASLESLQGLALQLQKNGVTRTVTQPLLAFRVYPNGREELVRGVRFKEFSAKDLRDLGAAGDKPYVLNYINNGSLINLANSGGDATISSVICPSLLFESLELDRAQDETGKPPVVPPPALTASK